MLSLLKLIWTQALVLYRSDYHLDFKIVPHGRVQVKPVTVTFIDSTDCEQIYRI